ncbi:alpha/beta hydrolase [Veillonellaceae bacterium WCA-693-APC-5D-A]|uniref:Alpha/beta hydrolase n=1 Tax=Anaerovibrio slackiae TaxID=2652309 RepID=A0A6I2UC79_9FIRM|nr:alpha/beta hydrolase [Anaerovibrio slackiae]MSU08347.1 alpha/beta hydrolase [Anaerovibrio slackiae]
MKNNKAVLYVHGKGGNAAEAAFYEAIFPECDVMGFDYKAETPWESIGEFQAEAKRLLSEYDSVILVANSIGAYFSLLSLADMPIEKAYFISPIANMEKLILDMMQWAGVTEDEIKEKGVIATDFGEDLSWEYLTWVRSHPVSWHIPTEILYGSEDNLQSMDTVKAFTAGCGAGLTVMEHGEHWFHTEEQMQFLREWLVGCEAKNKG